MATFSKIPATPNRIRMVLMLVLLLLSSLVLFFNSGVRNAFYQSTWVLKLPASASEEYVMSFSSSPYLASLDKQNKELHWQGIPQVELNRLVEEINSKFEGEAVVVSEVTELLPPSLVARIIYIVLFSAIAGLIYLYFTEVGKFNSRRIYFRVTLLNLISLIWSGIVMLGILSSMSLVYKLTIYSFLSLVIMIMWAAIGYYLSLASIQKDFGLEIALENQRSFWRSFNRSTWNWLVVFVVLLSIGLGTVFVVDGVLIGVAVILASYTQQELPILVHRLVQRVRAIRFYKPTPKFKKSEATKPVANITKVNVAKPKVHKSNADKSKKKSKKQKRK